MKRELQLLCYYLRKNGYNDDFRRVKEIMHDITNNNSEIARKRLIAMCNPRYLGDLNIKEFDNIYEWWNFLSDISLKVEKQDTLKQSKKSHLERSLNNRRKILGYKNILARRVTRVLAKRAARRKT